MDKLVPIVKLSKRDIELYQENPLEFIKERDMSSYWKVEESIMMPKKEALDIVKYLFNKRLDQNGSLPLMQEFFAFC